MSSKFGYFVEIRDQKYEIVLNESDLSLISFKDIYPKIQQIVSIALNENIDFTTHEFEIFENYSPKGLLIKTLNDFVGHQSVIRIKPKLQEEMSSLVANHTTSHTTSHTISSSLSPQTNEISEQSFGSFTGLTPLESSDIPQKGPPNVVTIDSFEGIPRFNYYCDVCPIGKVSKRLKRKCRFADNIKNFKQTSKLLKKIAEISDNKYNNITEDHWLRVIPQYMSTNGCSKDPFKWRKKFDSHIETYIRVLKDCPNPVIACNLFPFFHYFESIAFDSNEDICQKVNKLRLKLSLKKRADGQSSVEEKRSEDRKRFELLVKKLTDSANDIKLFHSMVMSINMYWDLNKGAEGCISPYWLLICNKLNANGFSTLTPKLCKETFHEWAGFYAQNYNQLNGKLEPNLQKTFDLLKVIHILDINKIMNRKSSVFDKITAISSKRELKEYFNRHLSHIRDSKQRETSIAFLKQNQKEIKGFKSLVVNIDLRWNCRVKGSPGFKSLSDKMIADGYDSYFPGKCYKQFHQWILFYAQNYDLLNSKLDEKHQNIFDLLKVIHILDLKKMISHKNDIFEKITEISDKEEIKDYYEKHLKDIRIKKLQEMSKSTKKKKTSDSDNQSIPQQISGNPSEKTGSKHSNSIEMTQPLGSEIKRNLETVTEEVTTHLPFSENLSTNPKRVKPTLTVFLD